MWEDKIAEQDWAVYEPVLRQAEQAGIRFAIGGAFALAAYTNHLRYTKDLDIYVLPSERDRMIEVIGECGLHDYYDRLAYDRSWIYRSYWETQIVDVIWSMPNRRASVDDVWLTRGPQVRIRDFPLRIIPLEELFWAKIYVLQRDRCDWPDVLNILYHSGHRVDWEHLLDRVGDDFPILSAIVTLFRWLSPERAEKLPEWLWQKLATRSGTSSCDVRPYLLDTRPWFGKEFKHWPG